MANFITISFSASVTSASKEKTIQAPISLVDYLTGVEGVTNLYNMLVTRNREAIDPANSAAMSVLLQDGDVIELRQKKTASGC